MEIQELLEEYIDDVDHNLEKKGKRLHNRFSDEIILKKMDNHKAKLIIPSESSDDSYTVSFLFDHEIEYAEPSCNCLAFENYDDCKHCVVAALYLLDIIEKKNNKLQTKKESVAKNETAPGVNPEPGKFIVSFRNISYQEIKHFTRRYYRWEFYYTNGKSRLVKFSGTEHFFTYKENSKKTYEQKINFIQPDKLEVSCTCGDAEQDNFCTHLLAALNVLNVKFGDHYFTKFKDKSAEKKALLAPYGLTPNDDEAKDFVFEQDYYGNLIIKSAPGYLVKINDESSLTTLANRLSKTGKGEGQVRPQLPPGKFINFELGYLFNFASKQHIHFQLQPLAISKKNDKLSYEKIIISKKENFAFLKSLPDEQYLLFEKLTDEAMHKHLIQAGFVNLATYSAWQQQMTKEAVENLREYYYNVLQKLWPFLAEQENTFSLSPVKTFSNKNISPIKLGTAQPAVSFKVFSDSKFINVQLLITIEGKPVSFMDSRSMGYLFIISKNKYFLPEKFEHIKLMQQFEHGILKFPVAHEFDVLRKVVLPLQQQYEVDVEDALKFESRKGEALPYVMVSEYANQYLMLKPQYEYENQTVDFDDEPDISVKSDTGLSLIERDKQAEKNFYERLRSLHPSFVKQLHNHFYYLPFSDVMKGNWFLHAIRQLQEENVTVKGIQDLKKFRYNTAVPKWEMKTGSGIDWFDLQIEVSFGDQQVPLRDLQKAIRSGQKIIVLGDGTFGVLPEEWLKQYSMFMKMGEEENGKLHVNKMHFTVIDELHNLIDEEDILKELEEKKQKLQAIESIKPLPVSKKIKAKLRPYQQAGFNWLQVLDELCWGGCLADDMGLGKTLQAICFLQYLKEKYKKATNLVVCPTSLIYNWESELQKFAPSLKYHIYYGSNRSFSDEHLENYDIIITSYGTMRIDIKELQQHTFNHIILDESQHIKNPDAQVTKATQLLKARNRIILSGTPVQNNTFDLFAQMHFLNPGFLGNKEFFKTEFATPIDKNGSGETAAQLRKLIFPFMLRRTKEQVAPDLPDKTETVLWCEMDKAQRAVYDEYKNYYRHRLMNKIEEEGMGNASMYILEGLMRLRQICDSPVLVKDEEVTTTESIKMDELLREVLENTGGHKLIVFSQFTEMLALVREAFSKNKITHLYLDGSTPATKRKDLVAQFQTDPNIKAFLISLKAGGVGLNLTAADYVYLIDPWWNPAVEDQAIDRTHRIGQTNKVFAYKMICKDTVEEKILQMQQKKKSLSKELISEEKSFIKKLSKDDVEFLFS
ncbi:MAG: SNF2-related protein [Ginsengibacter sp.]